MPIRAEGTKGLNRRHRAGSDVFTIEKFLETLVDGFEGCLGKKAEQGTFSFKQTTKRFRNAVSKVPVGYRRQDLFSEFFRKQPRALGLTGRAKVSRLTGESKQMLVLAGRAANPSEASMKSSTIQKGFYRGSNHTSQRSRLGFEPLFRCDARLKGAGITTQMAPADDGREEQRHAI